VKERIEAVGDLRVEQVEPLPEENGNLAFRVNSEWVFRFPKTARAAASAELEMELLDALRPVLPVRVPQFSYVGRKNGRIVVTGGPWYGGFPLTPEIFENLSSDCQESALHQLADLLQAVHAFPATSTALREEALKGAYNPEQRHLHDQLGTILSYYQHDQIERIYQLLDQDLLDHPPARTVIHADLKPEHLQIDPATGQLEAVLDWGDACLGDPDYDLALLHRHYGEDFVRRLLAWFPALDIERVLVKVPSFLLLRTLQDITIDVLSGVEARLAGNLRRLDELIAAHPGLEPRDSDAPGLDQYV
jgi:aminoglycoside 2''-phosphotransferase